MLVGAGTVLSLAQASEAVAAGAQFIVTPALNDDIVRWCQARGVPIFPGVATAGEVDRAMRLGIRVCKFFPAEASGGLKALKALAAPYGMMKFMPTGGISTANVRDYLGFNKVVACGGSWMVKESLFKDGDFSAVTRVASEAMSLTSGQGNL